MEQKMKKGISIRMKLICVIIPIVIVMIISFFTLSRLVVLEVSEEKLEAQAKSYAGDISAWTGQIFGELQIYKDAIESGMFADDAATLEYMETSVDKSEAYPVGLYMGDDAGVYLDGSGWVPGDDWILIERDWYVDGKDNEGFAFGEPYYDSMTGQVCVSASARVNYEKAVRVLATDVYLDYVSGLMADIAAAGEVEAFLITGNSQTIIAHPDTEMMAVTLGTAGIDSLYGEVGAALQNKESGMFSAGNYLCCLNPIENTDWYLAVYVMEKEVLADMYRMENYMLLIAIVATAVLIFVILRIMNRIVKPVTKVTNVIGQIAEGDFTQNIEAKGNDEIARMSKDMQMFIEQMRGTISEIKETAGWLDRQAYENMQVSDSLKASAGEQAQAMSVLDRMVRQLSKAAEDVNAQMEQLSALIGQARIEGESADALMKESVVMSESGRRDMDNINTGMTHINTSITTLAEQIEKVGQSVVQIGDMVNMIMDIAEETNLLSLNASIEAARAGEAGRGFAVVAEQIGKLAANSSTAADDISSLTEEIRSTVTAAVEHMNSSVDEVQKNVTMVAGASTTFEGLYEKVEETGRRVGQMIELVGKVNMVASNMEQTTVEQMAATEQIVDSAKILEEHTGNVTDGSNQVANSAGELKRESAELANRVSRFKLH